MIFQQQNAIASFAYRYSTHILFTDLPGRRSFFNCIFASVVSENNNNNANTNNKMPSSCLSLASFIIGFLLLWTWIACWNITWQWQENFNRLSRVYGFHICERWRENRAKPELNVEQTICVYVGFVCVCVCARVSLVRLYVMLWNGAKRMLCSHFELYSNNDIQLRHDINRIFR